MVFRAVSHKIKKNNMEKKIHGNIFSENFLKKWSFRKKIALEYDLFCIVRKDHISFFRKYDLILEIIFFEKKNKQKNNKEIYFLYIQ